MRTQKRLLADNFKKRVISKLKNLPLDVYHSFLLYAQKDIDGMSDLPSTSCPKCLLPYSKRCYKSHLLSLPRKKSLIQTLLWREKTRKTSHKDKCLIAAYRNQQNVFVFQCTKCGYKRMEQMCRPKIKRQEKPQTHNSKNQCDAHPVKKRKKGKKKSQTDPSLKPCIKNPTSLQPPHPKENQSNANEFRKETYKNQEPKIKKGKIIKMKPNEILQKINPLSNSGSSKKATPSANKMKLKNLQCILAENSSFSKKSSSPSLSSFLKSLM